jgi:hypothetical protein
MNENLIDLKNKHDQLTFEEYETRTRRIAVFRFTTMMVFIVISFSFLALYFFVDLNSPTYLYPYLAFNLIGAGVLFFAFFYPRIIHQKMPEITEEVNIAAKPVDLSNEWHETVVMKAFWVLFPAFFIFIVLWAILIPHPVNTFRVILVTTVMIILGLIFGKLDVRCTPTNLSFKYGPFGNYIPVSNIKTIRAISLRTGRDFLGRGIDIGSDGTTGYIAGGNTGVLIQLKNNKNYRLTVSDPQSLVDYVRAARAAVKGE